MFKDNGLEAWEKNASFWDDYMGDESNYFHRDLVRPYTENLLEIKEGDHVLDIACGNGNFSAYLAEKGVQVTAFDYSEKMIELAIKRRQDVLDRVRFLVCDATSEEQLATLGESETFDKAVANMAIMDISNIKPLFEATHRLLKEAGTFVFATHHPWFTYPNEDYFTSCIDPGEAILGQPMLHNYYYRAIQDIFKLAFESGFVIDGFHEVPFKDELTPIIMIIRLRKN